MKRFSLSHEEVHNKNDRRLNQEGSYPRFTWKMLAYKMEKINNRSSDRLMSLASHPSGLVCNKVSFMLLVFVIVHNARIIETEH